MSETIEIIGSGGIHTLTKLFESLGVNASKTYQSMYSVIDEWQVWELTEDQYKLLCSVPEDKLAETEGHWMKPYPSVIGSAIKRYNINGYYLLGHDGMLRTEMEKVNRTVSKEERWSRPRKYRTLLEYIRTELNFNSEKDICNAFFELAKQNNMKISELLSKYQDTCKEKYTWSEMEDDELFHHGVTVVWLDATAKAAQNFVERMSYKIGHKVDYSYTAGRAHVEVMPEGVDAFREAMDDVAFMDTFYVLSNAYLDAAGHSEFRFRIIG